MTKWVIVMLLIGMAAGVGLWLITDPQARIAAANAWNSGATLIAGGGGTPGKSLLDPIAQAFTDFADSVAGLWSPDTIRIEAPSIQVSP